MKYDVNIDVTLKSDINIVISEHLTPCKFPAKKVFRKLNAKNLKFQKFFLDVSIFWLFLRKFRFALSDKQTDTQKICDGESYS